MVEAFMVEAFMVEAFMVEASMAVVSPVDITPAIMGTELATLPYTEPPPATDRDASDRREPCSCDR
jgi:hypothetical protein